MRQRRNFERDLLSGLVLIAGCVVLSLTLTGTDLARKAMDRTASFLAPLEAPVVFVMNQIGGFRRWTAERRELLMELEDLRERERDWSFQAGRTVIEDLKRKARKENVFPVIHRDPRLWWEELRISTGGEQFAPGSAVLDGSDLVGFVTAQDKGTAWVRLITSSGFYVPVVVEDTREIGVVSGDDEGGVWLRFLPADGVYTAGMKIFTVLGSRLPAGLPVGELTSERRTLIPGVAEYRVKPGADIFRLQYLFVMKGEQP